MSIDEEIEVNLIDVSLLSILENRNECLNKSEVWAILKETCVALKQIEEDARIKKLKLDINCLIIDTAGNIKVEFEQYKNKNSALENGRDKECLIHSLGEVFKYILDNYSDVNDTDELVQFVDNMLRSSYEERFTIHNIEIYADRQLNGSSVDLLYHEFKNVKRSEDLSSAFQDSFFSTEFSVNSEDETDTDQSLCISKDFDTFSIMSDGKSFENSEESKYFVCLNQLWSHSLDPIFRSDQECLIFIYVIMKEMSNILLNEDNFKKCLCITKENVFLNPLGQMLLNFPSFPCANCNQEEASTKYHDIKYINTIGSMLHDLIWSDRRNNVSNQIRLLLQRMRESTDMIINEILHYCKASSLFQSTKCRFILKGLFDRWNYWFNIHLTYLSNLKHKYLCEISTKNLIRNLKPTPVKVPLTVQELFKQNPSWLSELKYATKLSKTNDFHSKANSQTSSAFRPYNTNKMSSLPPPLPNTARIKTTTHFRPLVLTSESSSVHRSQDLMSSPLDVMAKYTNVVQSKAALPSTLTMSSSKTWRSMNHITDSGVDVQGNKIKSDSKSTLTNSSTNCSSKVNLIIDIIQSVLSKTIVNDAGDVGDRHLLGVADFALSLSRTSRSIFIEAMKQRFDHIQWTKESLEELYDIISIKDICTPLSDNKSNERCFEEVIYSTRYNSTKVVNTESIVSNPSTDDESRENSGTSSSTTENDESFEAIEKKCSSAVNNVRNVKSLHSEGIDTTLVKAPKIINYQKPVIHKLSSKIDTSSDISDYSRTKSPPVLPNKLKSSISFLSAEDTSFYQQIFPVTLLCFQSTLSYVNQPTSCTDDQMVNSTKIQELLTLFHEKNKTIHFKFKELSKTIGLISKCDCGLKNDKKIKKQFLLDHNELQLCIESLILEEMKLENTIVEYHSLSLETILEEIKFNQLTQSIVFANDVKNFHNLQFIHPTCLIACLFAKGAVSSGLMYDFFLVYREFYKPKDFIDALRLTFNNIERKLFYRSIWIGKARFRLLYIILCWIAGFYDVDFSAQIVSLIKELARTMLVPYIKDIEELLDKTIINARGSKTALSLQFTALSNKVNLTADIIHNVDIQKMISSIEKNEKDKEKLYLRSSIAFHKNSNMGNQDTFSILNISPRDLAVCLTLIQQLYFNSIHPCHLLLYLRSLSDNEDSILNSINNDRFPIRTSIHEGNNHKEVKAFLLLSGQITHWAVSEVLLTTDPKLQSKIVKKLVITCNWCKELNNFATMTSIVEALTSDKLKWAPFWVHVSGKITRTLKDLTSSTSKLFNSTSACPDGHEAASNALLSGVALLPCIHAILVHLKMSSFGKCLTRDCCLKWNKLKKLSKILDQIRLYKQFRYISNDGTINELRTKLKVRIDHLTSISLDILQSHNMLTQTS